MSYSYTIPVTSTFTVTHARHLAAKVATDLKRIQRFYGYPSDSEIGAYETEVIELLKAGYLETITFGFKRDGNWIEPTLRYTAHDLAGVPATDDDPGRVLPGADISEATFWSYLTYSPAWNQLSLEERDSFKKRMPFYRSGAPEPGIRGYLSNERTYSSGGRALRRASVRNS